MDTIFHPAVEAIKTGDLENLKELISKNPALATARSSISHPTLLQCLTLDGKDKPNNVEMARVLINAGAELDDPLLAAASIDNRAVAELLIDNGANVDGVGGWSPLEEALYWNSQRVVSLLIERGAKIRNLRTAAGLGMTEVIENFFDAEGHLRAEAGQINWPWGDLEAILQSNLAESVKRSLAERFNSWKQDRQAIINNAFVYACMHGYINAAKLLFEKGAEINVVPGGFDYAGTGLHYAALNGHRAMVEWLLAHGADRNLKDPKVGSTAAGWAEHAGHSELVELLR